MKHIKLYESNDSFKKLEYCRSLFDKAFSNDLYIFNLNVVGTGGWNLYAIINKKLDNNSIKDFESLFNFLKKINEDWKLFPSTNNNLRLDIYFNDIDKIISELEILVDSDKYNL